MTVQVPGRFLLVDHSIVRAMEKGALGVIEVGGDEQPGIFKVLMAGAGGTGGHYDRAAPSPRRCLLLAGDSAPAAWFTMGRGRPDRR